MPKKTTKKAGKKPAKKTPKPSKLLKEFAEWTVRNVELFHNVGHLRDELEAEREATEAGDDSHWKAKDLDAIEDGFAAPHPLLIVD